MVLVSLPPPRRQNVCGTSSRISDRRIAIYSLRHAHVRSCTRGRRALTMPHWHTTASSGRRDASARARDRVVVLILVLALIGGLETPHVGAQPGKPPAGPGM